MGGGVGGGVGSRDAGGGVRPALDLPLPFVLFDLEERLEGEANSSLRVVFGAILALTLREWRGVWGREGGDGEHAEVLK